MPLIVVPTSQLFRMRVAALLFTCVAFSAAAHGAYLPITVMADWCIFCWAFSFACTLLVLLVELFGLQARVPVSWSNFPITVACYAALLCLSASIIFPVIMYLSATILWPVFQFNKSYGRNDDPETITASVITAINLLLYVADLVYSATLVFVSG
ncbi:myeloid-associated differentiation marker-like [Pundamilia nyererei]|uniref:Myeloid-associated differentiation marker-like n=1 Tax=Pundamilia nyererei TaxID=303518 RepID=A0A9Y6J5S4_9CICH|nr:PREDICTED: myeloid-associated differentiation marker-like [Pundamilia nyererei]